MAKNRRCEPVRRSARIAGTSAQPTCSIQGQLNGSVEFKRKANHITRRIIFVPTGCEQGNMGNNPSALQLRNRTVIRAKEVEMNAASGIVTVSTSPADYTASKPTIHSEIVLQSGASVGSTSQFAREAHKTTRRPISIVSGSDQRNMILNPMVLQLRNRTVMKTEEVEMGPVNGIVNVLTSPANSTAPRTNIRNEIVLRSGASVGSTSQSTCLISKQPKVPMKFKREATRRPIPVRLPLQPDMIVFAKLRGYRPWPASIKAVASNKCMVEFLATKDVAKIKLCDVYPFCEVNVEILGIISNSNSKFATAFRSALAEARQITKL